MKFENFLDIRKTLVSEGIVNESTKSYKEYSNSFYVKQLEKKYPEVYEDFDKNPFEGLEIDLVGAAALEDFRVNEVAGKAGAAVSNVFKNIIGFMRIKALAGKYTKSMVDEAIADMDYARRKKAAGAGAETKDNAEQLKTAHDAKKEAIKDRTKAIAEKIDNIASTEFLKKVATRTKIAARIKKNEVVLRIASKEEAKELKLKNGELTQDLQRIDGELRDYEKDNADEIEDAKKQAAEQFKEKITELTDQIKEVRKEITDAESEISDSENEGFQFEAEDEEDADFNLEDGEEEAGNKDAKTARLKAYQTIGPLKQKIGEFYEERAMAKQSYNEAMGEEEYDPEDDQESAQNAYKDAEEYQEKAEKLEQELGEEPEEETEDETGASEEEIEAAQQEIDAAKGEVDKAKADKEKADGGDDEAAKKDAEKAVINSEIKFLQAKQKKAKLEKDDEAAQGFEQEIAEKTQKLQDLENKEPAEKEPAEKELTDKEKERLEKAKAGLEKAQKNGDDDKAKRYQAIIDSIESRSKDESIDMEGFWDSIDEELNLLEEESTKTPHKIAMTFEEFRASRK